MSASHGQTWPKQGDLHAWSRDLKAVRVKDRVRDIYLHLYLL